MTRYREHLGNSADGAFGELKMTTSIQLGHGQCGPNVVYQLLHRRSTTDELRSGFLMKEDSPEFPVCQIVISQEVSIRRP